MSELTHDDIFHVLKAFFEEKGLVRQHLDSYNDFIEHGLQEVIDQVGELEVDIPERPYKIVFGRVRVGRPCIWDIDTMEPRPIYPREARLRDLTYAAPIYLEMTPIVDGKELETEEHRIGLLPVMLKSKICALHGLGPEELMELGEDPNDPGGYFIINGSERVMVAMEDLAPNRILVDVDEKRAHPVYQAKVFSSTVGFRARIEMRMKSNGAIYVSIPGVPTEILLPILMRALGMESDKEIAEAVSVDPEIQDELEPSFARSVGVTTVEDAIMYIGNRVAHGQV
ncbi:DNA-directed RNA polymerase subunit B, partial [Thermococci archaeon]